MGRPAELPLQHLVSVQQPVDRRQGRGEVLFELGDVVLSVVAELARVLDRAEALREKERREGGVEVSSDVTRQRRVWERGRAGYMASGPTDSVGLRWTDGGKVWGGDKENKEARD